jgi:DNA-binding helix-hairpin-helix protein with protein kinase domain
MMFSRAENNIAPYRRRRHLPSRQARFALTVARTLAVAREIASAAEFV